MQTRKLGNSDLNITPIGFGAWAIGGGGWAFGWGAQDDADSVATIREAIDLGINWIDTAAVYGLGHSEEVVAKALEGVTKRPYVFTKCARVWDEHRQIGKRLKAASIRAECEASLKRLKVDVIDLYQVHWPEPPEDIDEGWQTMMKLKAEGKIRWVGVSNFSAEQMAQVSKFGPDHVASTAVLDGPAGGGGEHPAVLPREQRRGDRVLADGERAAHRGDDPRTDRGHAGRRLAEGEEPALPGAAADAQPEPRGTAEGRSGRSTGARRARWRWRGCCGTPR